NGVPADFLESDLDLYRICQPVLTVALPFFATEGDGVLAGQGSVGLHSPLGANLTVNLLSSDPSEIAVPPTVVVLAGETNAAFDITVIDDLLLDGTQKPSITASAPGFDSGGNTMSIFDNESALLTISLPASAMEGDGVISGSVSIPTPADKDVLVS